MARVAADANLAGETYPDQSLYPANSAPSLVKRLNAALTRADQIQWAGGEGRVDYFLPIVADAEAGFGGALNAFEIMKAMLEAGAAGVHFEDQLASEKKCGHMGGKVLVPTGQHVRTLTAARLAADVLGVPALLVARTDANGATLLTSDIDERDQPFVIGNRTAEGFFEVRSGLEPAIARSLAFAPTPTCCGARLPAPTSMRRPDSPRPSMRSFPASCSPTTARRRSTGNGTSTRPPLPTSRRNSARWATSSSSSPLPGSTPSTPRCSTWRAAMPRGMPAYVELQEAEFAMEPDGNTATRHQQEVGAGYFDLVAQVVTGGAAATLAMEGSTEEEQFEG